MINALLRRLGAPVRALTRRLRGDSGMATAEYAVATLAAVAFAALLLRVLTSPSIQKALAELVEKALK